MKNSADTQITNTETIENNKLIKVHQKTIERTLQKYILSGQSIDGLINDCRIILNRLREYPEENKNQIHYYEKLWMENIKYRQIKINNKP